MKRVVMIIICILLLNGCKSEKFDTAAGDNTEVVMTSIEQKSESQDDVPEQSSEKVESPSPRLSNPEGAEIYNKDPVDLDGDGAVDEVTFQFSKDRAEFILTVNDIAILGHGDNLDGFYAIVDIDCDDQYKEIAIAESGPSSDLKTEFILYDGRNLIPIGKVQGDLSTNTINGNGKVLAATRGAILQTWFYSEIYVCDASHQLVVEPKEFYEMNTPVKIIHSLVLQNSPTDNSIAYTLKEGESVTIVISDNKNWCMVENEEGKQGWFAVDGYNEVRGTNHTGDYYFEGLSQAD